MSRIVDDVACRRRCRVSSTMSRIVDDLQGGIPKSRLFDKIRAGDGQSPARSSRITRSRVAIPASSGELGWSPSHPASRTPRRLRMTLSCRTVDDSEDNRSRSTTDGLSRESVKKPLDDRSCRPVTGSAPWNNRRRRRRHPVETASAVAASSASVNLSPAWPLHDVAAAPSQAAAVQDLAAVEGLRGPGVAALLGEEGCEMLGGDGEGVLEDDPGHPLRARRRRERTLVLPIQS
jgi:hypothetical protein